MKRLLLIPGFCMYVFLVNAQNIFVADPTYDYTTSPVIAGIDTVTQYLGNWGVFEKIASINQSSSSITLKDPTGQSLQFLRDFSQIDDQGVLTWAGNANSGAYPNGITFLTIKDDIISGTIKLSSTIVYGILFIGDNHYVIHDLPDSNADCDAPFYTSNLNVSSEIRPAPGGRASTDCSGMSIYRLIIAYTPEFAATFFPVSNRQDLINEHLRQVVASVNQTYVNSNIPVRARLAFSYMTLESETGNTDIDFKDFLVDLLLLGVNGKFDQVNTYSTYYRGDAAVLLTAQGDGGIAARWPARRAIYEKGGDGANGNFGVAHEIGHLFGLQHNREEFDWWGQKWYDGRKAYGFRGVNYRTIMSYQSTGQTRVGFYSNPTFQFPDGQFAGDNRAQATSYLADHIYNVLRHDDPDDLLLTSNTYSSDQMANLFAYNSLTASDVTIDGSTINFRSEDQIILGENTWIRNGSTFTAQITPCANTSGARVSTVSESTELQLISKQVVDNENDLVVYPNPVTSILHVYLDLKQETDVYILVRDMHNRIVYEISRRDIDKLKEIIDMQYLSPGIYLVEVLSNEGFHRRRVVLE